jgi:hypothetical protein
MVVVVVSHDCLNFVCREECVLFWFHLLKIFLHVHQFMKGRALPFFICGRSIRGCLT